jgi:hypothetical protein
MIAPRSVLPVFLFGVELSVREAIKILRLLWQVFSPVSSCVCVLLGTHPSTHPIRIGLSTVRTSDVVVPGRGLRASCEAFMHLGLPVPPPETK